MILKPLISISTIINNKENNKYHKQPISQHMISEDVFCRSGSNNSNGFSDMELNDKLIELDRKTNLSKSPVDFIIPILLQFNSGKIDYEEMVKQIKQKTIEAQYYFSNMSQEEITENLRIFKKEFEFADGLNGILFDGKTESGFKLACSELIDKYNN